MTRLALRRWETIQAAAVTIGRGFRSSRGSRATPVFELPKEERRARLQGLCDS